MKAFGFPVSSQFSLDGNTLIHGEVWSEAGECLGSWTSSSLDYLEKDLAKHVDGYEYYFFTTSLDIFR